MATSEVSVKILSGGKRIGAGSERGGSFIEFSVVMPVLLLFVTGIFSFGFTLHNDMLLTNAVNTGGQLLAVSRGQTGDPCATGYNAVSGAAPTLTTGLSLTFVINGSTYTTNSCAAAATNMVQGASVQVTGTYPCNLAIFGMSFPSCGVKAQITEFIQ